MVIERRRTKSSDLFGIQRPSEGREIVYGLKVLLGVSTLAE